MVSTAPCLHGIDASVGADDRGLLCLLASKRSEPAGVDKQPGVCLFKNQKGTQKSKSTYITSTSEWHVINSYHHH